MFRDMAVEVVAEAFAELLEKVEAEFQNSLEEVILLKDLQKLVLPETVLENLRAGSRLRVYRWIASKLVEKGLAKPSQDIVDRKLILQLHWKERNNPGEIQPLPRYFYLRVKELFRGGGEDLLPDLIDIHSLRLNKLMSFAAKRISPTLLENLTEEEKVFYETLLRLVNIWFSFISPGGGRGGGRA